MCSCDRQDHHFAVRHRFSLPMCATMNFPIEREIYPDRRVWKRMNLFIQEQKEKTKKKEHLQTILFPMQGRNEPLKAKKAFTRTNFFNRTPFFAFNGSNQNLSVVERTWMRRFHFEKFHIFPLHWHLANWTFGTWTTEYSSRHWIVCIRAAAWNERNTKTGSIKWLKDHTSLVANMRASLPNDWKVKKTKKRNTHLVEQVEIEQHVTITATTSHLADDGVMLESFNWCQRRKRYEWIIRLRHTAHLL